MSETARPCHGPSWTTATASPPRSGRNPQRYCAEEHMRLARTSLRDTILLVQHIAEPGGYDDPLHFSHVFHRHHGMSPRAFRSG